jgi:PA14 domain/PEP-CTERM motif
MSVSGWAAIALAFAMAHEVRASEIVFSTPNSSLPATAGNGLVASYYRPTGGFEPGSIANANAYIANHGADATFVTTGINYAAGSTYGSGNSIGDGTPLSTYLGSDANSLVAVAGSPSGETTAQVLANTLDGTMYVYTGYLAVTAADINTPETFFLGSDDGSALYIQGQQIIANDGDHGFAFTDGGNTVEFTQAGLYAIRVLDYEDGGVTGVEFGSTLVGPGAEGQELTAANFYQTAPANTTVTPEPSSLTLLGTAGVIACGFLWNSRRRLARA